MERKGKIIESKFIKEWTGDKGTVYYHDIKLDNGDHGQIGTKERLPDKIAVGQELTYTIEEGQYGSRIKAVQQSSGGGFRGRQQEPKIQMISFAMAYTKDLVVAGKVDLKNMSQYFDIIYQAMISKI